HRAWWVFEGLPQANYRVWVSWGSPALPTGSNIPYMVYSGGVVAGGKYRGGTLKGTFVANQTKLPTDASFNGAHWQSLGSHWAEGRLAVEIHGPQGVPAGLPFDQIPFSFADAVRIEGVSLNLGSGSRPAAHLTANTWAAMSEYKPEKAFGYKPPGKDYTVFGIQEQPFITEAFATHTSRVQNPDMTWVEDSWKWGAAIELMNFSSREIDLKDYGLVFGTNLNNDTAVYRFPNGWKISAATNTKGGVLVLYDFGAGKGDVTADDVFGVNTGQWKQVEGLNFDKHTIRLVRIAKDDGGETYNIPIDHVGASTDPANHWAGGKEPVDLEYAQLTEEVRTLEQTDMALRTLAANSRRDDSLTKHRYSVAKYKKTGPNPPATHKLGQANAVTFPETTLKEGFRIKLPHGLLSGPGAISDLYLVGPILYDNASSAPADLPELLAKDYAIKESRGRANSHVKNDPILNGDPWNVYPRQRGATEIPWPLVLGEVIETVPMDLGRGDSPTRVYGRININTASQEVLKQLPWPTGINAASGAAKIIAYRNSKGGFVTPGELALAMEGLTGNDAEGQPLDRDSIYAAISSCVTVNSDMYAVTVRVQLGASKTPAADRSWYYLAVIDRGCAMFSTDKPAVLLFTQLK
ncbi:MAG: helix-hairpin-helix domain-containing protein, partial [Phycisphaerae bacterium]|nr:helix-hairpin-helix domain-containing protein [Phycisphaerae bacterium]